MKSRVLSFTLALGCSAFSTLIGRAGQKANTTVGVFIEFESVPGSAPVRLMEEEAEKLLRPSGISLDWRSIKLNRGAETFSGVVVLKFKGDCRSGALLIEEPLQPFGQPEELRTLARTQVEGGRVLPFGEVECDQVRQALAYVGPGAGKKEKQRAMGLALGRVVAHELYHMLARTTRHAAEGLAKSTQSLDELISPRDMHFQDRDSRAIREGFRAGY